MTVAKKQKLELTWIDKENRPRLEPHILAEQAIKIWREEHRSLQIELAKWRIKLCR